MITYFKLFSMETKKYFDSKLPLKLIGWMANHEKDRRLA